MTAPNRRLAGVRARGSGAAFETFLARFIFPPLVTRGALVRVDKLDPPTRPTWDAGRRRVVLVPVAAGGADFLLLAPGGLYIAVEAKSTSEARFYRDDLPAHQAAHLDQAVAAGGAAYLALQFRYRGTATAYLIPWARIPWGVARTAQSVTASDLAPWAVRSWIDAGRILDGGQL